MELYAVATEYIDTDGKCVLYITNPLKKSHTIFRNKALKLTNTKALLIRNELNKYHYNSPYYVVKLEE